MASGLVQTYEKYSPQGVVFIGLTPEGSADRKDIDAFLAKYRITWPNGYAANKTLSDLGVSGFPTLFVVDADGTIVWNDELGGNLTDALDQALAART